MNLSITQNGTSIALFLAITSLAPAQEVMHTDDEIFVSGHFFSLVSDDLAIIDRATGEVRSVNNAVGGVVTGPVLLSGIGDITDATSGSLGLGGVAQGLMLVSTSSQSLARLSPAVPAGAVSIYESPRPAPVGLVAISFPIGIVPTSNDLWLSSHDLSQSSLSANEITVTTSISTIVSSTRPERLREGRQARASTSDLWHAAFMADDVAGSALQFFSGTDTPSNSLSLEFELSGLPLGAGFVWGALDATTQSTFVFFVPGSPTLHWIRTAGSVSAVVSNIFVTSAGVESLIPVNQGSAHGVWAILDGGSEMQLLQFDGTGFTVTQSLAAPAGQRWTGGRAKEGGSTMLMLHGPAAGGGSTAWQRFDVQGDGTYNSESMGFLPALISASPAHVFAFSGEPFVDVNAALTDTRRVADWTLGTSQLPGSLEMSGEKESFDSPSDGLGSRTPFNAGAAAAGSTWMMANQYSSDTSVFALLPGTLSPTEPTVTIVPEARHEELAAGPQAPALLRSFSFESTSFVWYRTNPTASFALFNPSAPDPEFMIATSPANVTVEYYAKAGNQRSRIRFATYSFGASDPLTAPSMIDADSNGLADEWEAWYGLTDPNGDPDNDGINNITEQNFGSDPLGHCGNEAIPLDFTLHAEGSPKTLHLTLTRSLQPGEVLQTSTDLEVWTDLRLTAGSFLYTTPLSDNQRFYRIGQ